MVIACVCFVGKHNEPLSLQFFGAEDELSLQFAAYAALDIIEERMSAQQSGAPYGSYDALRGQRGVGDYGGGSYQLPISDSYLGYICPALCLAVDYRIYAYVTTTGLQILAALKHKQHYPEQDLKTLFRRLHRLYADSICNPFLLDTIETPRFLMELEAIVQHYSKKLDI